MERSEWIELVRKNDRKSFNDLRCGHGDQSHICDNKPVADMEGADFRALKLERFNFYGCNLQNANFEGSSLKGVDFALADLRGANFRSVNYSFCSFQGADMRGVDFRDAKEGYFSLVASSDEREDIFEGANTEGVLW